MSGYTPRMSHVAKKSILLIVVVALVTAFTIYLVPQALAAKNPPTVSLTTSSVNVSKGSSVNLVAKVRNGVKGQKLVLQQLNSGKWKKAKAVKLAEGGKLEKVSFKINAAKTGTLTFRAKVAKKGATSAAKSKIRSVVVSKAGSNSSAKPNVSIVDYGFGQSGRSATAVVIVTNNSKASVGQYVTATVNFMDASGRVIATEDQVEQFNWVGQKLVLPVWTYPIDPDVTISDVDPYVSISDYSRDPALPKLPVVRSTDIVPEPYGDDFTVNFSFTNKSSKAIDGLRVGVVCYDSRGRINGGDSIFPRMAPPQRTIVFSTSMLDVSSQPSYCDAYLNYS